MAEKNPRRNETIDALFDAILRTSRNYIDKL